jgi:hypothetical protein
MLGLYNDSVLVSIASMGIAYIASMLSGFVCNLVWIRAMTSTIASLMSKRSQRGGPFFYERTNAADGNLKPSGAVFGSPWPQYMQKL